MEQQQVNSFRTGAASEAAAAVTAAAFLFGIRNVGIRREGGWVYRP